MREIKVRLKKNGYSILVGQGILPSLGARLKRLGLTGKALILTNEVVGAFYLKRTAAVLKKSGYAVDWDDTLPLNESAKSEKTLFRIYSRMMKAGLDRSSFLVALGGGIVGDVTGFAAATYMRGIPWVGLPTTLLAQVDSSIGGKTGINLPDGKNLVGAFHQPRLVAADTDFIETLPSGELCHALAEVIKYAVIWDAGFFSYLEKNIPLARAKNPRILEKIVYQCARIKKTVVERDEREEKNIRAILNYGHTFAHGFEAASESWTSSMPHGEAVALGMLAAAELACRMGLFSRESQRRQFLLIREAGLPVRLKKNLSAGQILKAMMHDKKAQAGKLRFILPLKIGKVEVHKDIPLSLVRRVIGYLQTSAVFNLILGVTAQYFAPIISNGTQYQS